MTQIPDQQFAPVVFLDTNAVHYSKLVLTFGGAQGLNVLEEDWEVVQAQLEQADLGKPAIPSYEKGFWILRYLHRRSEEPGTGFYYSPITQLELLCGSLRGAAIKKAANSGVPNRWYVRVDEKEVGQYLEPDGYTQVKSEQQEVNRQFEAVDIALSEHPVEHDVWGLAQRLLENIFVDVQDCLVYSSALLLQANELITTDGYLGRIVNRVFNPGSAPPELIERFRIVRSALVEWLVQVNGWSMEDVILPEQRTVKQMKQFVGGGTA